MDREIVDWPTEEGWWWMQSSCSHESDSLVYAQQFGCGLAIQIGDVGGFLPEESFEQREHWCANGPARFTKLLEPNPFTAPREERQE